MKLIIDYDANLSKTYPQDKEMVSKLTSVCIILNEYLNRQGVTDFDQISATHFISSGFTQFFNENTGGKFTNAAIANCLNHLYQKHNTSNRRLIEYFNLYP